MTEQAIIVQALSRVASLEEKIAHAHRGATQTRQELQEKLVAGVLKLLSGNAAYAQLQADYHQRRGGPAPVYVQLEPPTASMPEQPRLIIAIGDSDTAKGIEELTDQFGGVVTAYGPVPVRVYYYAP